MFPEALNTNNLKWKYNLNDDLKKLLRYFNLGLSADDLWYKISKKQKNKKTKTTNNTFENFPFGCNDTLNELCISFKCKLFQNYRKSFQKLVFLVKL